jgi:hypothetical protein
MEGKTQQYVLYKDNANWPVIWVKAPVLVSVPVGFDKMMSSLNLRIPVPLERTLDAHCKAMGIGKSEWVRKAMQDLLSVEQQWLEEHGK